jgi:hypothetical protein
MLREQFARFKTAAYPAPRGREKANEIRDSLLAIPRNLSGIKGIGCVTPVEDYAKPEPKPQSFSRLSHIGGRLKESLTKPCVQLKLYLASTQSPLFTMMDRTSMNCAVLQ